MKTMKMTIGTQVPTGVQYEFTTASIELEFEYEGNPLVVAREKIVNFCNTMSNYKRPPVKKPSQEEIDREFYQNETKI